MLISRGTAPAASLVWSVEKTRCPVKADRTASSTVSPSRISPTRMTSGSCRRIDRSPEAKVSPAFTLIWHCRMTGSSYSTGSSSVTMLRSRLLM